MDETTRKDKRRDSFLRKKKFKKIHGSSKLKESRRKENRNPHSETEHEPR